MAKIGTAQVVIKPVLDEDALNAICERIESAIDEAFERALVDRPTLRLVTKSD